MRRIIFINRFYWPDETATAQLLTDLAEALAARGREVTVITSLPPGSGTGRREEIRRGVRILRVGGFRGLSSRLRTKALDFARYYFAAILRLRKEAGPGDAVVALTDPPLIGIGVARVARRKGAVLHHWIQDIYPEVAMAVSGRKELGIFRPWRDAAWRQAGACVTLGSDMAAVVAAAGVRAERIHVSQNWALAGLRPPSVEERAETRAAWGCSDAFVVAYSGNFGRVHDVDAILDLAEALREEPRWRFVFHGGGPRREALEAEAGRRGLAALRFLPSVPRSGLSASLGAADVQLVTLRPGCESYVFPSKLYSLAATGRPVLFLGPPQCEIARLIRDHGVGGAFSRAEIPAAAAALRALAARPELARAQAEAAGRFAARFASPEAAFASWDAILAPDPQPPMVGPAA